MFPSFGQRPLTWLYLGAFACLLAVSLAGNGDSPEWGVAMLISGLYIVGASAAIAQVHRLARGAIWLAGVAGALAIICGLDGVRGEAIALVFAIAVAPLVTAAATRGLMRIGAIRATAASESAWRISIIEILGWMIIVAVASTGLRFADFSALTDGYQNSLWIHGGIVGALAGLFLTPERRCDRIATVLATGVVVGALLVLPQLVDDWYSEREFLAPLYAVFGLWILVIRLDEAAATKPAPLAVVLPLTDASQDE
jgi:hypothetical protein